MSDRYLYPQVIAYAHLDNEDPELTIVEGSDDGITTQWLRVENMALSVDEAAKGGGGKLRIYGEGSTASTFWEFDVNGVKDITLNFGQEGIPYPFKSDVKAILYGAQEEQASVYFGFYGHKDITGGSSS